MSLMGGIGMLSVGLIGGPGLGYARDRFSANELEKADAALYQEVKSSGKPSEFLFFSGVQPVDPAILKEAKANFAAKSAVAKGSEKPEDTAKAALLTPTQEIIATADIKGNRSVLKVDSVIPALMALIYLGLMVYFKSIGGYRPLKVDEQH
jgi:hypothetical protein